jgi:large subunit ribosomal protein L21
MYAVVKTGGKQYRVEEGSEVVVEKLDAGVGDSVDFDVLFYADGSQVVSDPAAVSSATVTAEDVAQFKGDKVVVFKFKKRKGYKRTKGHRQNLTRVKVTKIATFAGGAKKKAAPKVELEVEPKAAALKAEPKAAEPKAEAPKAEPAAPAQCEAVKGDGERCKNKAKDGSTYCGVHAKKYSG